MTRITTYADLIDRQAELQRIGKALGQRDFTRNELVCAYLAEVGEIIQECKPAWAWWKKLNDKAAVDTTKLLDELADALHFSLIADVKAGEAASEWADTPVVFDPERATSDVASALAELGAFIEIPTCDVYIDQATALLQHFGLGAQDLIDAYYAKTQVNLDRWHAVEQK